MEKYKKLLTLSALVLSSTQGILVSASELTATNVDSSVPITSNVQEEVEASSSSEGSSENSSTADSSLEDSISESDHQSNPPSDKETEETGTAPGSTTEKPEKNNSEKEVAKESVAQEYFSRKNLPRVGVSLKQLPVKNSGSLFRDISQSMFKNNINWIYGRGITTGYTPSTYNPNAKVTRGEMAVFLHCLAGAPTYKAPFNVYTDISQYKNQILWLTATTVSNGTAPHYNPNGKVTRGQMAAFLHRMAKASGKASASAKYNPKFWDVQNHMFKNDIGWLSSKGITTGYTATSFKPDADITRGEMAAFLYRFYSVVVNNQKLPAAPQPHANQPIYYSQLDARWKNNRLNGSNVGVSGCVPTSLAMILRGSYGQNVDPGIVAKKADTISHESFGLSGKDLINTAKAYGRSVEVISNINRAETLLRAGYPLIFYINVGIGHAVVVSDYDNTNGRVNINDPYGKLFYPSGKTTLRELWGRPSQDAMDWNAGRPVFAIK